MKLGSIYNRRQIKRGDPKKKFLLPVTLFYLSPVVQLIRVFNYSKMIKSKEISPSFTLVFRYKHPLAK